MFRRWIPSSVFCSLILAVGTVAAGAQSQMQSLTVGTNNSNSLWVTVTADKEHVRFASLSIVQRMRLEVLNQARDRVYDSDFREGSLLDWKIEDNGGQRLPDGLYGCVVTVEDISGQSIHRQGVFWLTNGVVQFGNRQRNNAEAAAPVEAQDIVTVLRDEEGLPIAHLAHDGKTGRIVSGKGGLSFRVGDFFSGRDAEYMRLTADGKLGLGIDEPAVKLDVAGLIRTMEGIVFPDGTIQRTAAGVSIFNVGLAAGTTSAGPRGTLRSPTGGVLSGRAGAPGQVLASAGSIGRAYGNEGSTNTFYGQGAGSNTTGPYNSFFGSYAGSSNTTGSYNSFVGYQAGSSNTTGNSNSFVGYQAGYSNTTGNSNSIVGYQAGSSNTTGNSNSFFGSYAGYSNTTGNSNSIVGYQAGSSNTTGTNNAFVGAGAGQSNTTGDDNSFVGYKAGYANTTGNSNSIVGYQAGSSNTTGNSNSFFGSYAGGSNTTGSYNSFVGSSAGFSNTTGGSNSFVGSQAGSSNTTASYNSFLGMSAGYSNTTGAQNTFVGYEAGYSNTTAINNSFFGMSAGNSNTTGSSNSFFGYEAGNSNTTGTYNSFVGYNAGNSNTTGGYNSFVGGYRAGNSNTTGSYNSFFGSYAGNSNTTASLNSFFGYFAGNANTTGAHNSFVGTGAGLYSTTGGNNAFFGYNAGQSITTESNNTFVGASSDGATGITNATAIGYLAKVTQSNSLVLGGVNGVNSATAETNVGIGVTNPDRQLTVEGSQALGRFRRFTDSGSSYSPAFLFERARGTQAAASDISAGDFLGKVQFRGRVGGNYPDYGAFAFVASDTSQNGRFAFFDRDIATERVSILNTGNVGIGTTAPTERLQVVGNLKVSGSILYGAPETDIPDYVFEPNYKLMRLEELEKFVGKEKHLPNMPQASEIKGKGLNLSEFQMKLLEKIEELTLYTVQQEKTISRKDEEIKGLNARLTALEQMMGQLTKRLAEVREQN